jgi:hypothetical protein
VHARDEAKVECVFDAHAYAGSQLRWVDFADDVGELGSGRKPLGVALFTRPPSNCDLVSRHAVHQLPAALRDRAERVVVNWNLRIINVRDLFVEKRRHQTHQPTLGLSLLAEEKHVVLGENRDVEFWDDRVVVADDAGVEIFAGLELGDEVVVDFLLNRFGAPTAGSQLGQRDGAGHRGSAHLANLEFKFFLIFVPWDYSAAGKGGAGRGNRGG